MKIAVVAKVASGVRASGAPLAFIGSRCIDSSLAPLREPIQELAWREDDDPLVLSDSEKALVLRHEIVGIP